MENKNNITYQIENDMDENFIYDNFLVNDTEKLEELYKANLDNYAKIDDIFLKEKILTYLMSLFPEKAELYFLMGSLFKFVNDKKALMWFKICNKMDPTHVDCAIGILQIIEVYFSKYKFVNHVNKNDIDFKFLNEHLLKNDVIRVLLGNIYFHLEKFEKIYEMVEPVNSHIYDAVPANIIYLICTGLMFKTYYLDSNTAHDYYLQSYKASTIDYFTRQCFMNLCINYDFLYYCQHDRYKMRKQINSILKNEQMFDLKKRKKNKKIKLGYVSADFITNVIMYFIYPVIENHNYDKFEIYLFTKSDIDTVDAFYKIDNKECLKNLKIININNKTSVEIANIVYKENIDILFDTVFYSDMNLLEIFSKNPAPIQISYLGYPGTTGLESIKYKITDKITNPENSEEIFDETHLYLPNCFLLYKSVRNRNALKFKPTGNEIILGSFHKEAKMNNDVFRVWRKIIENTHNTKILIKIGTFDCLEKRKKFYLKKLKIPSDRLTLLGKVADNIYTEIYNSIDLQLDTFPYSGTTITCNSLYNHIPIVTLYNKDYNSQNVTSSILINAGIPELVAYNEQEYAEKVITLCNNPAKLDYYKKLVKERFELLMDGKKYMDSYEKMLIDLYNKDIK